MNVQGLAFSVQSVLVFFFFDVVKIKDFVVNTIKMFFKIIVRGLRRLKPHREQLFGVIVQLDVQFVQTSNPIQNLLAQKTVVLRRLMLIKLDPKVQVEGLLKHVLRDVLQFRQSEESELLQIVLCALQDGLVPLFVTHGRHVVALHHTKVGKHSVKRNEKLNYKHFLANVIPNRNNSTRF